MAAKYQVYILRSRSTGQLYVGTTCNLQRRLRAHNAGHSRYTKGRGPWHLIHVEEYAALSEARKREWRLKHTPGGGKEKKRLAATADAEER